MKFRQHWPSGFRGEVVWNSQHFSYTNVRCPYKCIGKQTWPRRKTVKCQCTTIILATLVDLSSPMIWAKIQPQGILGSGEDFKRFLPYMGMGGHLGQWTVTILAIFRSPNLRRIHMKSEQNLVQWLQRRSRLKMLMDGRTGRRTGGQKTKSDHNSSSWA